ncbi:hypothetical protein Tcan_03440 [Toxocara canis]|uniref:C3H1-type domain-containing protein n=1 Tax=Toxocara canis TaxID=6265 RepID=A0A0B2VCG8_TOXCA|nr:hypothetical protein Tcan_03440 [Toxocara canis]
MQRTGEKLLALMQSLFGHGECEGYVGNLGSLISPAEPLIQYKRSVSMKEQAEKKGFQQYTRSNTPVHTTMKPNPKGCGTGDRYGFRDGKHTFLEELRIISPHDVLQKKDLRSDLSVCELYSSCGECLLGENCFFKHPELGR